MNELMGEIESLEKVKKELEKDSFMMNELRMELSK
jgi:hypothetical protein